MLSIKRISSESYLPTSRIFTWSSKLQLRSPESLKWLSRALSVCALSVVQTLLLPYWTLKPLVNGCLHCAKSSRQICTAMPISSNYIFLFFTYVIACAPSISHREQNWLTTVLIAHHIIHHSTSQMNLEQV